MKNLTLTIYLLIIVTPFFGQKAEKLLLRGEIEKTVKYCEKQQGDEKADCFMHIANYYFKKSDFQNADKYYQKTNDPEYGYLKIADECLRTSNYDLAENYYLKTINPEQGYLKIADNYLSNGNYILAEKFYDKTDLFKEGYIRIADSYFIQEDFENAQAYYKKAGLIFTIEELNQSFIGLFASKEIEETVMRNLKFETNIIDKLLTIFNPRILSDSTICFSYKLEEETKNDLMLVLQFIIKGGTYSSFYYPDKKINQHYNRTKSTFTVKAPHTLGNNKNIKIFFFIWENGKSKNVSNTINLLFIQ